MNLSCCAASVPLQVLPLDASVPHTGGQFLCSQKSAQDQESGPSTPTLGVLYQLAVCNLCSGALGLLASVYFHRLYGIDWNGYCKVTYLALGSL